MEENPETRPQTSSEPSIRTMKSDVESLLQGEKTGLTDIISQEVKRGTFRSRGESSGRPRVLLIAVGAVILAAFGAGLFFFFSRTQTNQPSSRNAAEKAPVFFRPDQTRTISVESADRAALLRLLGEISREPAPQGTITHISAEIRDGPQPLRPLHTQDLVDFARLDLAQTLVQSLDSLPMIFVYYAKDSGSIGIAVRALRGERAFSEMFSAEPSLASSLRPLFRDREITSGLEPFQDLTYRNIDYRLQPLSVETQGVPARQDAPSANGDSAIAYGLFPGKQLLIIATSRAGFEAVVDRLFEAR